MAPESVWDQTETSSHGSWFGCLVRTLTNGLPRHKSTLTYFKLIKKVFQYFKFSSLDLTFLLFELKPAMTARCVCLLLFISFPSSTAAASNREIISSFLLWLLQWKGFGCSGDKFMPGDFFFHSAVTCCIWGPNWINLSLSGTAGADIHQCARRGSLFRHPLGRDRDILSCQLKGTVPFLTPHPPSPCLPLT